jgi:hypothetical protein
MFARGILTYEVMSRAVNAEHKTFLDRPSKNETIARRPKEESFFAYASENSSMPPTQVTRALLSGPRLETSYNAVSL